MDLTALIEQRSEFVYVPTEQNYSFALDKPSENLSTMDPEKQYLLHKEKDSLMR